MRIATYYSHQNGLEYLLVHKRNLWEEIQAVVADVDANLYRTKVSKEKTKTGRVLYAPIEMK